MRDKVEQLQTDIETGVAELVDGEDWQRWLRIASRFPRYSFRNTLLILMQRPDATAWRPWCGRVMWLIGFQRGVMVGSRSQLGRPA